MTQVLQILHLAILIVVACSTTLAAQPRYSLRDLGSLGGETSVAVDINDAGHVVGHARTASGDLHAFYAGDGRMQDLGTFGGAESFANRITDNGLIVGRAMTNDGRFRPFVSERGGTLVNPQWFDDRQDPQFAEALGVNRLGQAVGYYRNEGGHRQSHNRVFLYEQAGIVDLGTFGGDSGVVAALNSSGHLVGHLSTEPHSDYSDLVSFIAVKGQARRLPTLGGRSTVALDINETGEVVGFAQTAGGEHHAFLYRETTIVDLGTLPGGTQSKAFGINDAGVVVGTSDTPAGTLRAVVYADGSIRDLNDLIPPRSGWVLTEARAINSQGQIVGNGIVDGMERAFLLTPLPQ